MSGTTTPEMWKRFSAIIGISILIVSLVSVTAVSFRASEYKKPVVDVDISTEEADILANETNSDSEVYMTIRVNEVKNVDYIEVVDPYGNEFRFLQSTDSQIVRDGVDTDDDGRIEDIPSYKRGDITKLYWVRDGERKLIQTYVVDTGERSVPTPLTPQVSEPTDSDNTDN